MELFYLKENIKMEKDMDLEKNIGNIKQEILYLKENIRMEIKMEREFFIMMII